MKKLICIVLILMLPVIALADDLSSMSFDDLLTLRQQITAEIMSRPEWKEVEVPTGIWIVGQDIPVGFYSIHPAPGGAFLRIYTDKSKMIINQGIRKENQAVGKIELLDGYQVEVSDGSLIFSPPISLGF